MQKIEHSLLIEDMVGTEPTQRLRLLPPELNQGEKVWTFDGTIREFVHTMLWEMQHGSLRDLVIQRTNDECTEESCQAAQSLQDLLGSGKKTVDLRLVSEWFEDELRTAKDMKLLRALCRYPEPNENGEDIYSYHMQEYFVRHHMATAFAGYPFSRF